MIRIPRQFITYLVVGGSAYLIEMATLYLLTVVFHLSDLVAVAISFWIGFIAAFILQKLITFKNREKTAKGISKQVVIYGILAGWNYLFSLVLVEIFADTTSVFWVRTVAIGIITLWNYAIYRSFIFKVKKEEPKRRGRKPTKKPPTLTHRIKQHFVTFKSPYVIFSAAILLITTIWWATLGAMVQSTNADQIIDSYLFHDFQTFTTALFPAAHTFLLKWPLFIIERIFNYDPNILVALTVFVSVLTVAGLAYILYRIDRRPKVIGTVFLALAGILLFIPAQPHAGGILPVNFAMLATRNIEYLFYILSLVLIVRTLRIRHWQTVLAVAVLTLLISSDKLFMWISLGGATLMIAAYLIARRKTLVNVGLRWLTLTLLSFALSLGFLWALNASGFTQVTGDSRPYGIVLNIKQVVLGIAFAFTGLLTNFGANPAFDIGVFEDIPKVYFERLLSPIALPVLINLVLFVIGLIAAFRVFRKSLKPVKIDRRRKVQKEFSTATLLTLTLVSSSVVAIGLFISTSHYYPVDSRYLTIVLFALSVAVVTSIRTRTFKKLPVKRLATVLLLGIAVGSVWTFATHTQQTQALNEINARNEKISEVILSHKTNVLVGDYWRVVPISQVNTKVVNRVLPLEDCTKPRMILTSESWQKDFKQQSFTYLLSLDKPLTDYPKCSINQIIEEFGRPNASALIAGTNEHPKELLLFYDGGVNRNHSMTGLSLTSTIFPTTPAEQVNPVTECGGGVTMMNIVAHEDDDLLFMNPDVQHAIDAKQCVRTVYVTAGDAGEGSQYWLGRERASEAAYETMLGVKEPLVWVQKTVKLSDHAFVNIATPLGHRKISLVYMHLPDGNMNGQGFGVSGFESLERLRNGKVSTIRTVDSQSHYSSQDLTKALTILMDFYLPTVINTQASNDAGHIYHDHEDHISVGRYVDDAHQEYVNRSTTPINYYIGYPIREFPQNVSGDDLARKVKAFLAYANYDGSVCQSEEMCDQTPTYSSYLQRQYKR